MGSSNAGGFQKKPHKSPRSSATRLKMIIFVGSTSRSTVAHNYKYNYFLNCIRAFARLSFRVSDGMTGGWFWYPRPSEKSVLSVCTTANKIRVKSKSQHWLPSTGVRDTRLARKYLAIFSRQNLTNVTATENLSDRKVEIVQSDPTIFTQSGFLHDCRKMTGRPVQLLNNEGQCNVMVLCRFLMFFTSVHHQFRHERQSVKHVLPTCAVNRW